MPVPSVWVVMRRPKRSFVGLAGGFKGVEDVVRDDAHLRAVEAGLDPRSVTLWQEHGEPDNGKRFTRASVHVASRERESWTLTYDCVLHDVYQRRTKRRRDPEPADVAPAHA